MKTRKYNLKICHPILLNQPLLEQSYASSILLRPFMLHTNSAIIEEDESLSLFGLQMPLPNVGRTSTRSSSVY